MIAPCRKSQEGLFQAKASFARIGSPALTFLASKRWTSSAHTGGGICAKRRCGGDQSRAKQGKTSKRLHHDIMRAAPCILPVCDCLQKTSPKAWLLLLNLEQPGGSKEGYSTKAAWDRVAFRPQSSYRLGLRPTTNCPTLLSSGDGR